MLKYILKRLFLVVPTLLGIIAINFFIIQAAPGGPVEQMINKIENANNPSGGEASQGRSRYRGDTGLNPEQIEQIKKFYGFDKGIVERFFVMLKNYLYFDFGKSYFRDISVVDLVKEKLPVSISLGLFSTLLLYLIGIPLGIYKARHDGTKTDVASSVAIVVMNAIPTFLFGILLILIFASGVYFNWFPLRGIVSDNFQDLGVFEKIKDYLWHITLPVIAITISGFAGLVLLVKNSFIDELGKYYVMYARIKGLKDSVIFYRHIFRNAMLLIISQIPGIFVGLFFTGSFLIEVIFSLDGLGLLGYESLITRDYPVIFGTLYIFTLLGLVVGIISDIMYVLVDPRIHFDR